MAGAILQLDRDTRPPSEPATWDALVDWASRLRQEYVRADDASPATELGAAYDLSIDIKDAGAAEPIIDIVRRVGDPARTWLCSPHLDQLRTLRADATDVRLVHSTPRRRLPDSLERHAADLAAAGLDAMNLRHSEWTKGLVALFHRFDLRAFAWDVQEVRHLRAMLEIGIDAVYCDHVERMVATVAEWSAG